MTEPLGGSAIAVQSRRRGSTANSTGLDHPSAHRVDEDILSRIRSLLLSRNGHRPPRTPYPSDEIPKHSSEDVNAVTRFDFSTARSIAKLTRSDSRLSLPDTSDTSSIDTILRMEPKSRNEDEGPKAGPQTTNQAPRRSSSMTDLVSFADGALQATDLNDGPSSEVAEPKKKYKYGISLQDKTEPSSEVNSCFEISAQVPEDDAAIHENDLSCCSPCSPPGEKASKYLVVSDDLPYPTTHAQPADLACFLAGCSPGRLNCKRHKRSTRLDRAQSTSQVNQLAVHPHLQDDFKAVAHDLAQDAAKIGAAMRGIRFKTPSHSRVDKSRVSPVSRYDYELAPIRGLGNNISGPSSISSGLSMDLFPHAFQSQHLASKDTARSSFSASIFTNFSLPGPKSKKPSLAKQQKDGIASAGENSLYNALPPLQLGPQDPGLGKLLAREEPPLKEPISSRPLPASVIRTKESDNSLNSLKSKTNTPKSKNNTPSLFSGASKLSAYRHALLKPSVTPVEPVDTGLPVPTVLTPIASFRTEISKQEPEPYNDKIPPDILDKPKPAPVSKPIETRKDNGGPSPVVASHLDKFQQTIDLVDNVSQRVQDVKQYIPAAQSGSTIEASARRELARTLPEINPVNAAYWGFVPSVKDAVQDAVQKAVQNAVSEVQMASGAEKDEASEAYRKLMAESMSQAAKNADDFLKRPSTWDETSPSWVVGIRPPPPIKQKAPPVAKLDPVPEKCTLRQKDAPNHHDFRHNLHHSAHPLPSSQLGIDLEQIVSPENRKQGTNASESAKISSIAGYGIIPDRHSSKNKVLGTRTGTTNSAQKAPVKKVPVRKRSYERLVPDGNHVLRLSFSADSLRDVHDHEKSARELLDLSDDRSSALKVKINGKLVHKSTVNWLRDILSSNGPYEPRLTALPPRTRRGGRTTSTTRGRSQTAPCAPVLDLYLGAPPNTEEKQGTKAEARTDGKIVVPETFTRTIDDLEQLLNEAIHIARQAADSHNPAYMPALLGNAAKKLQDGRKEFSEEIAYNQALRRSQRSTTKYSDDTSVGSMHESLRSYSGDGSSDFSEESEYRYRTPYANRSITVLPNRLKRDSGWPHTQRSSEPYQQPLLAANSNDDIDYIRAADPQSSPAEVSFAYISREASGELAQPEALGLLSASTPEFENEDPFSNLSNGTARKISERSPRGLSPTRKPEAIPNSQGVDLGAVPLPALTPRGQSVSQNCIDRGNSGDDHEAVKAKLASKSVPGKSEVREYIENHRHPPIQPRGKSLGLRQQAKAEQSQNDPGGVQLSSGKTYAWQDIDHSRIEPCSQNVSRLMTASLHDQSTLPYSTTQGSSEASGVLDFDVGHTHRAPGGDQPPRKPPPDRQEGEAQEPNTNRSSREREKTELRDVPNPDLPTTQPRRRGQRQQFGLSGKNHMSLKGEHHKGFSFAKSHKKPTIARDWKPFRKRFCATVACISTALVGILAGIYAGETPAIQYYIVDFHHYTVLGNVFFFLGLAIPTFFFWPLPLLHGRKPYILGSMSLAMPLLFPQALAVGSFRNPKVSYYRVGLIVSRALMGFCLGFANMNFKSTLTDLFGASLQSENPHQEVVDQNDVRRHGGGMGVWLGLWTWSQMGSIGVGFMAGAVIINNLSPAWGFYICIIIIAGVLVLNVITPEVRRSAFRRSAAEVRNGEEVSRRLARGEVKMHMVQTGPKWWGEEVHYGVVLTLSMLRQPGLLVVAIYVAWMYAQIVLLVILLGSLCSNRYKFKSPLVGLSVCAVPLGAMLAIPFQKASICSRSRSKGPTSNDDTYVKKKVNWSDHMLRRAIFILLLPFAGLGYTLTSTGPPLPFILPIIFAALMSFLTNLAMAECHGILMETFDTSDLQPGMTGRARGRSGDKTAAKRTNYSSFPRVASAFGITQGFGYMLAAVSTAVGGTVTRKLGQQAATAVVAGILLILSLLLLGVFVRFKDVQIIPDSKMDDMTQWQNARRTSAFRRTEGIEEDEPWRPVIIGNPTHHTRRMSVFEMGSLTRWSEIRRKNLLVDSQSLEAKHPNLAALEDVKERIKEKEEEIVSNTRRSLSRLSSGRSRPSDNRTYEEVGDLGGHVEMVQPIRSGKGSRQRRPTGRP